MAWITPVMDRTQVDIDYANVNQNLVGDTKGSWNISDINRVIYNSIYLKDLLISNGYVVPFVIQSSITESTMPYITSFIKVMKDNIQSLVTSFYSQGNPTIDYSQFPNYTMANGLEINLDITNTLLNNMIAELKYCGEVYSNEDIGL